MMKSLVLFVVSAVASTALADGLTARVVVNGGVPQIQVNGRPVRARMFWGAPGGARVEAGSQWQQVQFDFTALDDSEGRATIHFRFGSKPGEICFDEIRVVDLATGNDVLAPERFASQDEFKRRWNIWPPDAQNTVGKVEVRPAAARDGKPAVAVTLSAPRDGHWPDFHLHRHANLDLKIDQRYRVSLWMKATPGRKVAVAFYRPGTHYTYLGGPPGYFESQIKLAAQAGVDFVSFPIGMPWPEPGKPVDWKTVDASCRMVLKANPQALLLPRVPCDPPRWWQEAHANETMRWEDGSRQHHGVPASAVYRRDLCQQLDRLVRHLEEKFGDRVAGYHPCGQNTGEWFYQDTWRPKLSGYAEADQRGFRDWLTARYGDDARLAAAWHNPAARLASVEVPTAAARHAAPAGVFRDPQAERPLLDFAAYQQQAMAELVCDMAKTVRTASAGRKLVVFFYGYVFEFAAVGNGPSVSGHYAMRRAMQSPDIDILCSPISYFDRGLGHSAPAMTAAESVALANKMWLYEDDTATYLSSGEAPGHNERVDTLEETNGMLVRNVAQEAVRNFGTWWMDLGATGWFNDQGMWAEMKRLAVLDDPLLAHPTPFRPEVAAVIDERSMDRVAAGGTVVTGPSVYNVRRPLGRLGAPYGQYFLDDLTAGRVQAKLYVMLNAWALSATQRADLQRQTRGSTCVWSYAPGWFDDYASSPAAMRELTGFDLQPTKAVAWAEPTEAGKRLGLTEGFGVKKSLKPLFAAVDAKPEEVLATYADGTAAVALRKTAKGNSLFVGPPGQTAELLRVAARAAGVHLFTETDCNVYGTGKYLVLHGAANKPIRLNVGRPGAVTDLLSGQRVGDGPAFDLPLRLGETRVLQLP